MTTEDALRQAFAGIADLAPDPVRVRRAMANRIRRYRQRRLLLAAGGAAAGVAAVGGSVVLWLTRDRGGTDGNLPVPATEPAHPGNPRVPMTLRPTWLPDGAYERFRGASLSTAEQHRLWCTPEAARLLQQGNLEQMVRQLIITLDIGHPVQAVPAQHSFDPASPTPATPGPFYPLGAPPNTTIEGRAAATALPSRPGGTAAWFINDIGDVATLSVGMVPDAQGIAERVARSMVADGATACESSLRFGWVPPGVDAGTAQIALFGLGEGWTQTLQCGEVGIEARLATSYKLLNTDTLNDADATVRGLPGKASARGGYGEAVVRLDNGHWLSVLCYVGASNEEYRTNALRVADELVIGPDPYLDWIGRR